MKQIQIIGNIGRDATLHSNNGNEFVRFSVAVSEKFKTGNGETKENTDWFSVFLTQKSLLPYLKKGTSVFVQGKLGVQVRRNEQTGAHFADFTINAEKVQLLSAGNNGQTSGPTAAQPAVPAAPGAEKENDDLPF